jgi:hypothetical protein
MHDEGHSRKAYMMRVIPEKHTWWGSFQKSIAPIKIIYLSFYDIHQISCFHFLVR